MGGYKHLFVALSRKGWGETALGLEVARQVREAGDTVSFLAHSGSALALSDSGFDVQEVPEHMGPLIALMLDECLADEQFASIVLCDFVTTDNTLNRFCVNPTRILRYGLPVIALDTWEYDLTGGRIDTFGLNEWQIGDWIKDIALRLVPAPIGRPAAPGAYRSLSSPLTLASRVRRYVRRNLGLADADRAVLFCTAGWQHELNSPEGRRLATAVPELLWSYLAQVGSSVRVIHIGPAPLPLDAAGNRYVWMPAVAPETFDRVLASVDLFLSANISATTIARAIRSGVPVLVVQNSCRARTAEDARAVFGGCVSPRLGAWLDGATPLYPFSLWPLGYWKFLRPLLRDNPYCSALNLVELLDEPGFIEICRGLLFDKSARSTTIARQAAYADLVMTLPTAAELINEYLH